MLESNKVTLEGTYLLTYLVGFSRSLTYVLLRISTKGNLLPRSQPTGLPISILKASLCLNKSKIID